MSSYLGQNFLKDRRVIKRIVDHAHKTLASEQLDAIREIWPGKWAITRHLDPDRTYVFEKDETFSVLLHTLVSQDHIIRWDVLQTFPLRSASMSTHEASKIFIMGNLPYYITSPILSMICSPAIQQHVFGGVLVMIQHEVGEKIKSDATKKSYLRWICNYRYDVSYRKKVKASSFSPAPRVDSCMMKLLPKPLDQRPTILPRTLYQVLDLISGYKRKTLWKIIKILTKKNVKILIPHGEVGDREQMQIKRLEECTRDDMRLLCEWIQLLE